jgi:hypothetical protein
MWLYLGNHLDKRWSSLIEIMAMMAILWLAITAMFSTVIGGIYFATDSENRIKAINIAREWLEWVTNLRNTNWLRFSSDQLNCWRVLSYISSCIWSSAYAGANSLGTTPTNYVLENKNGAWYVTGATTASWLWIDSNGYYYATSATTPICTFDITRNCRSPFTRVINIQLNGWNTWSITATSRVDWFERRAQNVTIQTTLTNWKSKF